MYCLSHYKIYPGLCVHTISARIILINFSKLDMEETYFLFHIFWVVCVLKIFEILYYFIFII